jgi:predicted Zn-dependent protease
MKLFKKLIVIFYLFLFSFNGAVSQPLLNKYDIDQLFTHYSNENAYNRGWLNNIQHTSLSKAKNLDACIDSALEENYIAATKEAIEIYNELDFININYIISDSCGENHLNFTYFKPSDNNCNIKNNPGVMGCNSILYDIFSGEIYKSTIRYNYKVMDIYSQDQATATSIHEIGHVFGLKDLYEEAFDGHSVMYGYGGYYKNKRLEQFDIDNLNWFYGGDRA